MEIFKVGFRLLLDRATQVLRRRAAERFAELDESIQRRQHYQELVDLVRCQRRRRQNRRHLINRTNLFITHYNNKH